MLLVTSCATDTELEVAPTAQSNKFYASIEAPATRTYADEDGKLLWNANDEITLFQGNAYPRQFQFKGETGKNYGEFEEINPPTGVISANPLEANYAIYPYAANTTISNQGQISYTIPAVQPYAKDSFGLGANPMVAVTKNTTDNFLAFKNLCGYFEFSLYGDITVKSIEFKGNNNEKLAGVVTITATNQDIPTFEFIDNLKKKITLDCGDGVALGRNSANATKFWIVVPAIKYEKGISITITDVEGRTMTKSTSQSISIARSTVQPLSSFKVETSGIPNNEIWYTTTDGEIIEPDENYIQYINANIESNTYSDGKGVIKFDAPVTKMGSSCLHNIRNLQTIQIPNSVKTIGAGTFAHCLYLKEVILSKNITTFYADVFYNCEKLSTINGFENLEIEYIGATAFQDCESLESITIPESVTKFYDGVFKGCTNLKSVYFKSLKPLDGFSFPSQTIIYVPIGSVETYKTAYPAYADRILGY